MSRSQGRGVRQPRPADPRPADPRTVRRQLQRQLDVVQVLLQQRGEPLGVDALAARLGVSERTVERDLERLRAAQLPLRGRGGQGGGVWLEVTRTEAPLRLDDHQVMGLVMALEALAMPLPSPLADAQAALREHLDDPSLF